MLGRVLCLQRPSVFAESCRLRPDPLRRRYFPPALHRSLADQQALRLSLYTQLLPGDGVLAFLVTDDLVQMDELINVSWILAVAPWSC